MHYKLYSTEDFIQDDFFQQWVFSPNEESTRYWTNFLLHYPMQEAKIDEAREFLLAMNFEREVPESIIEDIRNNVNTAIDEFELMQSRAKDAHKPTERKRSRSTALRIFAPLAASILLIGIFIGYFVVQKDISATLFETLEEEKASPGEKRHIVLADGSEVWLNADSKVRYSGNFSESKSREIYLEGEAFFDIAENEEKPFIVHASGLAIKVVGTAFNVRSYEKDRVVETTLVEGKVSIESVFEDSVFQVTLLPNQQALFRKDSGTLALEETVKTENHIAWKNGWMIFDDKPFSFIKETMERWYDVSIHMEDEKSLSCTFSGRFKDKTLQEVLEIFRSTESIQYRIEGKQVFISGKLCSYEPQN
jgi:transmembrane sensor